MHRECWIYSQQHGETSSLRLCDHKSWHHSIPLSLRVSKTRWFNISYQIYVLYFWQNWWGHLENPLILWGHLNILRMEVIRSSPSRRIGHLYLKYIHPCVRFRKYSTGGVWILNGFAQCALLHDTPTPVWEINHLYDTEGYEHQKELHNHQIHLHLTLPMWRALPSTGNVWIWNGHAQLF